MSAMQTLRLRTRFVMTNTPIASLPGLLIEQRATRLAGNFREFAEAAWPILEPTTPLVSGRQLDARRARQALITARPRRDGLSVGRPLFDIGGVLFIGSSPTAAAKRGSLRFSFSPRRYSSQCGPLSILSAPGRVATFPDSLLPSEPIPDPAPRPALSRDPHTTH
jgi:hypothetical protein